MTRFSTIDDQEHIDSMALYGIVGSFVGSCSLTYQNVVYLFGGEGDKKTHLRVLSSKLQSLVEFTKADKLRRKI